MTPVSVALYAARLGDRDGLPTLRRLLEADLVRELRELGLVEAEAEEVAAETWREVGRDFGRFVGEADEFRPWVAELARELALDRLRRRHELAVPLRFARFSSCGRYRYHLARLWNAAAPPVTFVMLNPSTADSRRDDATVRRCVRYARDWGYGGIVVVNLYAWRSTWPRELWRAADPIGPENDASLANAAQLAAVRVAPIVAAWGAHARPERVAVVRALPGMDRLTALAFTRSGAPRHPLYLRADLTLVPLPATDSRFDANTSPREHAISGGVRPADDRAGTTGLQTAHNGTTQGDHR